MRNAYLKSLYELAKKDPRILALVADNGAIVYDEYREEFPNRFLNFGIAEANMISVAAGLASSGKIPFTYTIASFITMRAFEQVRNDVCLQKMNVKMVGIGAGFVYSNLGPTHHAVEDIAIMKTLPGMTIFVPCDKLESQKVTEAAAAIDGPVYIRLATGGTPDVYKGEYDFAVGKGVVLQEGKDVTVITTGSMTLECLEAVEEVSSLGIAVRLINMHTLKPIDREIIVKAAVETKAILTVEDHTLYGGLGSSVADVILEEKAVPVEFKKMGLEDTFPSGYGSFQDMKEMNGLSKKDIVREIKALHEDKKKHEMIEEIGA